MFAATEKLTKGRFEIVYQQKVLSCSGRSTKSNLIIYRDVNDLVLKSTRKTITALEVYSTSGIIG